MLVIAGQTPGRPKSGKLVGKVGFSKGLADRGSPLQVSCKVRPVHSLQSYIFEMPDLALNRDRSAIRIMSETCLTPFAFSSLDLITASARKN